MAKLTTRRGMLGSLGVLLGGGAVGAIVMRETAEPTVPERRTLRVLFYVSDVNDVLKPGMFAEVGLGTDERPAIQVPATALLHIGRNDYVLRDAGSDQWSVTKVRIGEIRNDQCEVMEGLKDGDRIISRGAILLKTVAAQSLTIPGRVAVKP